MVYTRYFSTLRVEGAENKETFHVCQSSYNKMLTASAYHGSDHPDKDNKKNHQYISTYGFITGSVFTATRFSTDAVNCLAEPFLVIGDIVTVV